MDTVNVLILYGGEAATAPRDMLLNWLNMPEFHAAIGKKVDARKVAEMVAHNEDSIDVRVEKMMEWADKGIFLLTPDTRSDYGAPNVLEEFGRWIGQKGRRTMLTLRHEEVKVHSNASGLVYVGFKSDDEVLTKCRDRIVAFINEVVPPEEAKGEPKFAQEYAQMISGLSGHSGESINIGDVGGVGGSANFSSHNNNTTTINNH